MEMGVYQIRCIPTNKLYVGSAVNIRNRWRVHQCHLRKGTHHSPHLQNAWNKYGSTAFELSRLEIIDKSDHLISREQWWIDFLKPQLNIRTVADSQLGTRRTPEQRKRMCESQKLASKNRRVWNKGKQGMFTAETIERIRAARARQTNIRPPVFTDETRRKMSLAKVGKKMPPRSDSHRRKLSVALTGQKWREERRQQWSEYQRGRPKPPRTPEHCLNISKAKTGRKHPPRSDLARKHLSEAMKLWWRQRHEQLHTT